MGDISINAKIFPYRFKITDRGAAELSIDIENNSANEKKLSLSIALPDAVSFDKIGTNSKIMKQFEEFKPNHKMTVRFPVYLSARARVGSFDGTIKVQEHLHEFGYVSHSYTKGLAIRIVD